MVFHIHNCQIRLEFGFILILAFSLISSAENVLWLLLFASLHETGHILSLLCFGGQPDSLTLSYYGVGMKHSVSLSVFQELLFLLSGVMVNGAFVILNIHREINFALFLINILPLYPLDGGRALKLVLNQICNLRISAIIFKSITVLFTAVLIICAVKTKSISLILIAAYILIFSFSRGQYD